MVPFQLPTMLLAIESILLKTLMLILNCVYMRMWEECGLVCVSAVPMKARKRTGSPRAGATAGCRQSDVCWVLNPSLPQEQYVFVVNDHLSSLASQCQVRLAASTLLQDGKGLQFSSLLPFVLSGAIAISITMQTLKVQVSMSPARVLVCSQVIV